MSVFNTFRHHLETLGHVSSNNRRSWTVINWKWFKYILNIQSKLCKPAAGPTTLLESVQYKLFVTLDSSCQVTDRKMLVVGVGDENGARTVEIAFMIALQVGNVGTVIDCGFLEACGERVSKGRRR